jgi:CubicO group peptidase (beta-lactamase class C family)
VVPVAPTDFGNAGAAASLQSSASDMARWLDMLLECGRVRQPPAGRACVLRPDSIRLLWSAQTVQGTPDPPPGLEATRAVFAAYGLGFGLRDYHGRKVVSHAGGLPGYVSQVALVPEERLGLVVLTNQEETGAFEAVKYRVFDACLGAPVPPVDWIAAFRKRADDQRRKAERPWPEPPRRATTSRLLLSVPAATATRGTATSRSPRTEGGWPSR